MRAHMPKAPNKKPQALRVAEAAAERCRKELKHERREERRPVVLPTNCQKPSATLDVVAAKTAYTSGADRAASSESCEREASNTSNRQGCIAVVSRGPEDLSLVEQADLARPCSRLISNLSALFSVVGQQLAVSASKYPGTRYAATPEE